jgi:cytochrome P450
MIPAVLQPLLVWMLPHKWRLRSSLKELESFVVSQVEKRKAEKASGKNGPVPPTLLAWMVEEAKHDVEEDPYVLTQLLTALAAGGTYSSANFIVSVLLDLVAHRHFLKEIREEICDKHKEINGNWNFEAFNTLHKLDSAFKETMRLTPGSLTTYSRVMLSDYTLSNGIPLKKGQFICVSSYCRSKDPTVYPDPEEYDALRAYNRDFQDHIARPFKGLHGQDFRWGAGRWACAGRYLASLVAKVILVKLLDEYDFEFAGDRGRPSNSVLHEFIFIDPGVKIMMRRRENALGIEY